MGRGLSIWRECSITSVRRIAGHRLILLSHDLLSNRNYFVFELVIVGTCFEFLVEVGWIFLFCDLWPRSQDNCINNMNDTVIGGYIGDDNFRIIIHKQGAVKRFQPRMTYILNCCLNIVKILYINSSTIDYDRPDINDFQTLIGNGIGGKSSKDIIPLGFVGTVGGFIVSVGNR